MTSFPTLKTNRLTLRFPEITEAAEIVAFCRKNETHLLPWEPLKDEDYYTIRFWRRTIQQVRQEFQEDRSMRLNIYESSTRKLIGMINFTHFERGAFQSCRLGYKIDRNYEGKGMMFESLEAGIQYVFNQLNFHRIEASYIPRNKRSASVLKRLGFQITGMEENYLRINGRWECHILTSLLNPEWKANPANIFPLSFLKRKPHKMQF